jgi:hypothetical protein
MMASVTDEDEVIAAAKTRACALAGEDESQLRDLLHPSFGWISHKGEWFDLDSYLDSNHRGSNTWHSQELQDIQVHLVGDTAVLRCVVKDRMDIGDGKPTVFTMPMTRTWVRAGGRWRLLTGHAGPRTDA